MLWLAIHLPALPLQVFTRGMQSPSPIVIDTTAAPGPGDGLEGAGHWWDVAVPAVGASDRLRDAYARYIANARRQATVN